MFLFFQKSEHRRSYKHGSYKKKGVLQRERCIFSPFIKENSLVSTDNPSYIPTATKISSSVIELPYNCLFTNCLLINGTGAKQKETNKSLN